MLFFILFPIGAWAIKITSIRPTPLYPRVSAGEELKQLVRLSIMSELDAQNCELRILLPNNQNFSQRIDLVKKGEHIYNVLVPDITDVTNVTFNLLMDGEVAFSKTETWKPQKNGRFIMRLYHIRT